MFMNIHELPHNLTYDYDDVEVILAIYRLCGFILKYRLLKFETLYFYYEFSPVMS